MFSLSEISQFILAVFTQWIGIVGGVITLGIELWERWSAREVHWRTYTRIVGPVCLLIAVFLVWRDEYQEKLRLQEQLSQARSQLERAAVIPEQGQRADAPTGKRPESIETEQELRRRIEELQRKLHDLGTREDDD